MVNAVRSFLPTDLPALVAHAGLSYENEAWPRERLGAGVNQATLSVVRDQVLAFARRRSAWVCVRRQRLQGLAGARQRGGSEAWEIDYLIDATRDRRVTPDLLEVAIVEAGREGAQKLFLRLSQESALLQPARETGFVEYQEETLYVRGAQTPGPSAETRPAIASDSYPLFRLYCEATPEATRRLEASTFAEWHASQERRWLRGGRQLVLEQDGRVRALLRAARLPQGLLLDIVADAESTAAVDALVSSAVIVEQALDQAVLILVPQAAEGMARRLEDAGFVPQHEFVSLLKRTAKPLALPKTAPVVAKNAIGV